MHPYQAFHSALGLRLCYTSNKKRNIGGSSACMKAKELTTVAQSRRDSAFSQDMWQAGCEEAVERGTEKNVVQNARYLHGDPPADRHLARDEAILIINPLSVMWGEKHITTGTRSPLRSPFGSATGLLDPQKKPQG